MNIKHLSILVGPPGSGKSTYANVVVVKNYHPQFIRISQDDQGRKKHRKLFTEALERGENIIVDRMNFNKEQRARYIKPAKELGYHIKIYDFTKLNRDDYIQICIDRIGNHPTIKTEIDAKRAVNFFFDNYEKPCYDESKWIIVGGEHIPDFIMEKYNEKIATDGGRTKDI